MKFFKSILPALSLTISLCFISACNTSNHRESDNSLSPSSSYVGTVYSKSATNSDIGNVDFEVSERSVAIRFIPTINITDLVVKVQHLDADKNIIDSQIITVGDTIEGQQYVINSTLTENSFTAGKKIGYCSLEVYSGTIYYTLIGGAFIKE